MIRDWVLIIFCYVCLIAIPAGIIWAEWYLPSREMKNKEISK